jgi:molybdopterin/thiamine biosynthesis adenylyltransferase
MQTYFMVGAGGTGTHLLPALLTYLRAHHANRGDEYQVVIADGDIFEAKNQARQLFAEGLIATNKAEAMVRMYQGHPLIAVSRYIGAADIEKMVQDGDCVLICADNYSVRALIADHAQTLDNVVVVNGGNEYNDGTVQLWIRENGENITPNIKYGHPEIKYLADDDRAPVTCAQAANSSSSPPRSTSSTCVSGGTGR